MSAATPTQLIDNDRVRVTEWKFKPGESTSWHRHELDYVVVPITRGQLQLIDADGERTVDIAPGIPYYRDQGVEHDVINPSATDDVIFVEIEIK